jgi:hypothetical protein
LRSDSQALLARSSSVARPAPQVEPEGKMTKRRERVLAVTSVMISLFGFLALAEILLRFLPVAGSLFVAPVTPKDPIYHFAPNREFIFSRDWNLTLVNRGRINNDGWINNQDYQRGGSPPVLAIIGDSYIAAAMVPYAQTVQGRIAEELNGELRIYSFAAPGAPLSQYLIWAQYAVREFKATALVINVVGNDFDESHITYHLYPGFWIYAPDSNGDLRLQLTEFRSGMTRTLLKHSALARYLFLNMQIKHMLAFDLNVSQGSWLRAFVLGDVRPDEVPTHTGNTDTRTDEKRLDASMAVIDAFFRDLPNATGLPADRITFTMDGFRYPEAATNGTGTYFDLMRQAFRERAEKHGYEVIDLDPLFFADYRAYRQRFEYPNDDHWNPTGHAIVAKAIMASRLVSRMQTASDKSIAHDEN